MFLYRPHVHQLDGTITPDLAVDHLLVDGEASPAGLSPALTLPWRDASIVPAVIVFAAGFGSLLSLGFLATVNGEASPRWCLVSRAAWRLDDVRVHAPRLLLDVSWGAGGVDERCGGQATTSRWSDPPRATACCWSEPSWRIPAHERVYTLCLHDLVLGRALSHSISKAADSAAH